MIKFETAGRRSMHRKRIQKHIPSLQSRPVPGKAPAGRGPLPDLLFAVILPFIGIAMAV
jgi:hypothetical protein